jgi:hypothetical protein
MTQKQRIEKLEKEIAELKLKLKIAILEARPQTITIVPAPQPQPITIPNQPWPPYYPYVGDLPYNPYTVTCDGADSRSIMSNQVSSFAQ